MHQVKIILYSIFITGIGLSGAGYAEPMLDSCIRYYEDGEYQKAVDGFKSLLPLAKGSMEQQLVYEYLAFSYVMLDMIETAKSSFKEALTEFPDMKIDTISVSPNISVVFNQAKMEHDLEKQKKINLILQSSRARKFYYAFAAAGAASAGISTVFYVLGEKSNKEYYKYQDPDEVSKYRRETRRNYLIHYISLGTASAAFGLSAYKFFTRPKPKDKVGFEVGNNKIIVSYYF